MALPYRTKLCGTFSAFTFFSLKAQENFLRALNLNVTLICYALKYTANIIDGEVSGFTKILKCLSLHTTYIVQRKDNYVIESRINITQF